MEMFQQNVTELYLFSDGSAGQNKSYNFIRFLLALAFQERLQVVQSEGIPSCPATRILMF
jgi:hypothetical protein